MKKTWGFNYYPMKAMHEVNPNYNPETDETFGICDSETFESESSDFHEACKEFDEFIRGQDVWDIDPEASFDYGKEYRRIIGEIDYEF